MSAQPPYLSALRRQWRLIAVLAVLGAVGGAAYGAIAKPEYTSTSQVLVALRSDGSTADRLQGANYVDSILATYTSAVTSSVVLTPVEERLGLDKTLTEMRRTVTATSTTGTAIVSISATGTTAAQAQSIADAVTKRFVAEAPGIVSPVSSEQDTAALQAAGLSPAALTLTVVDEAALPEKPSTPGFLVTVLLGLLAGLLVGAAVALLRFRVDDRVRDDAEIEAAAGAPVLGHLPSVAPAAWHDRESDDAWTEAVRGIRTALFSSAPATGRIVQLSSSSRGEGVSSAALALARSLGRSGQRVLLADADLRTPTLHDELGLPLAPGLAEVVAGAAQPESVVTAIDDSAVSVVTAGAPTAAAGDLVASEAFGEFLRSHASEVDVTIVDTPSIDSVSDASALARIATDIVLVVAAGASTRAAVTAAAAKLSASGTRIAGVVVTHGADTGAPLLAGRSVIGRRVGAPVSAVTRL